MKERVVVVCLAHHKILALWKMARDNVYIQYVLCINLQGDAPLLVLYKPLLTKVAVGEELAFLGRVHRYATVV